MQRLSKQLLRLLKTHKLRKMMMYTPQQVHRSFSANKFRFYTKYNVILCHSKLHFIIIGTTQKTKPKGNAGNTFLAVLISVICGILGILTVIIVYRQIQRNKS